MKKLLLLIALLASIYSCTKTNDLDSEMDSYNLVSSIEHTGKWELIKMTGSFAGQESTGSDMQWQEAYVINEDGTFSKTRVQGDSTIIVSGTYQLKVVEEIGDRETRTMNIELLYDFENKIIGDCSPNKKIEQLYFTTNQRLSNTWNACDGPGLEYLKSK